MNAADITNAIVAMELSSSYLSSTPYTTSEDWNKKWKVIEQQRFMSSELKRQLSEIDVTIRTEAA